MAIEDDEIIDESNVLQAFASAIKSYHEKGMILDAIFWGHILNLLRNRYPDLDTDFMDEVKKVVKNAKKDKN